MEVEMNAFITQLLYVLGRLPSSSPHAHMRSSGAMLAQVAKGFCPRSTPIMTKVLYGLAAGIVSL
jgi:hypothetical protein